MMCDQKFVGIWMKFLKFSNYEGNLQKRKKEKSVTFVTLRLVIILYILFVNLTLKLLKTREILWKYQTLSFFP